MLGSEHQQFLAGLTFGRSRTLQCVLGDPPFRQLVQPGEVVRAAATGDLAGPEQMLQGDLGVVPVPPGALRTDAGIELARRDRAVGVDPGEDFAEVFRTALQQPPDLAPFVLALHPPAVEVIVLGRHMARLVDPVLEQLAVRRRVTDQVAWMRPKPREKWQLLAAHEHVDGIDLDQADLSEHLAQVPAIDLASRPRISKSLGGEGDPARLVRGDVRRRHGRCYSETAMLTELMTTSSTGRSPRDVLTLCIASSTSRPFTI